MAQPYAEVSSGERIASGGLRSEVTDRRGGGGVERGRRPDDTPSTLQAGERGSF